MQNDTPSPTERRLIHGTLWSMLGIAALGLTRLLYTALVGRTGPPERLAEVNAQISLAFVATFVTAAATGAAAAKFIPLTGTRFGPAAAAAVRRKLARWTAVGTTAVLVVLSIGWLAGIGLLPGRSVGDLVWVGMLVVAYGGYTFTKSTLYGYHLAGRYAVLELLTDVGTLTLTVVAVLWLPNALLAPLVVGYAAFTIAAARSTPSVGAADRRAEPELGSELGGFVAYTAIGVVASQGFFQVSMLVARSVTDGAEAGVYAAAMSLVTPAFFLPRALALVFFPTAAEAVGAGDRERLARQTRGLTRMLWLTMLPMITLGAVLGEPLLRLIFGPAYSGGGTVLAILLAAVLLYIVAVPSVNALSAHELDHARIPPLASVAGVLVGGGVWLLAGTRLGAVGVALGYLAGLTVQAGVPLLVARARLPRPEPASAEPAEPTESGRGRRASSRWMHRARAVVALAAALSVATLTLRYPDPLIRVTGLAGFGVVHALLYRADLARLLERRHR